VQQLERIASAAPACGPYVERMRTLAREFKFDAMTAEIEEALR
jgi:hypothetical protein